MRFRRAVVPLLLTAFVVTAVPSSVTTVAPGEAVLVRRFGRLLPEPWGPGIYLAIPFGGDKLLKLRVDETRTVEIGHAGEASSEVAPGEGEYLTGDLNLVRIRCVTQYRIDNPVAYILNTDDPSSLLNRACDSALANALTSRRIDDVLGAGRASIAEEIRNSLSTSDVVTRIGVRIQSVSLTDALPPSEVRPAFDSAQNARGERDSAVRDAETKAATTRTEANASAGALLEKAEADANRMAELARGRAKRFLELLAEVGEDRRLSMQRIYTDRIRELFGKVGKSVVLGPDEPIDLTLLRSGTTVQSPTLSK